MTSTLEDAVLDFDLNFLKQSCRKSSIREKLDKQKRGILLVKKKTMIIDALIKECNEVKEKLNIAERSNLDIREEYKETCINYKIVLEKCAQLDDASKLLRNKNEEYEVKYVDLDNQYQANLSHIQQLQSLIQEQQTLITSLKNDNQLGKSKVSESDKKNIISLKKDKADLVKHIFELKDVILGKKKLDKSHKALFKQYEQFSVDDDSVLDDDGSSELDDFDNASLPKSETIQDDHGIVAQNFNDLSEVNANCNKNDTQKGMGLDHDSDCSNGVVSEDTGCGSSLAFYETEKCFNSPDYTDSSPTNSLMLRSNNAYTDTATSPIHISELVQTATSPVIFEQELEAYDNEDDNYVNDIIGSPEYFITDIPLSNEVVTIKQKKKLIDASTSPMRSYDTSHRATSPIIFDQDIFKNYVTSPIIHVPMMVDDHNDLGKDQPVDIHTSLTVLEDGDDEDHVLEDDDMAHIAPSPIIFEDGDSVKDAISVIHTNNRITILEDYILERKHIPCNSTSPISFGEHVIQVDPEDKALANTLDIEKLQRKCTDEINILKEINVLEQINGTGLHTTPVREIHNERDESINDCEVESILKKMRFNCTLITPIPRTPSKSNHVDNTYTCKGIAEEISDGNDGMICHDAMKVRDENKTLQAKVSYLSKEILMIKNLLKRNNNISSDSFNDNYELFDDSSRETIWNNCESQETLHDSRIENNTNSDQGLILRPKHKEVSKENIVIQEYINEVKQKTLENDEHEEREHKDECILEEKLNNISMHDKELIITDKKREGKRKAMTKLEKIRNKLVPRSKIKKLPPSRLGRKLKPINTKKMITDSKLEDGKIAYEKAVKIMKDLKSKKIKIVKEVKQNSEIVTKLRSSPRRTSESVEACNIVVLNTNNTDGVENTKIIKAIDSVLTNKSNETVNSVQDKSEITPCKPKKANITKDSGVSPTVQKDKSPRIQKVSPSKTRDSITVNNIEPVLENEEPQENSQLNNLNDAKVNEYTNNNDESIKSKSVNSSKAIYSPRRLEESLDSVTTENQKNNLRKDSSLTKNCVTTRSRSKQDNNTTISFINSPVKDTDNAAENDVSRVNNKAIKRSATDLPEVTNKRILRSSHSLQTFDITDTLCNNSVQECSIPMNTSNEFGIVKNTDIEKENEPKKDHREQNTVSYDDLDLYSDNSQSNDKVEKDDGCKETSRPEESILCVMIEKYGQKITKRCPKKVPDNIINSICNRIEEDIANIINLQCHASKIAMNNLVEELMKYDTKHCILSLVKYLSDPQRRHELLSKVDCPPAPPMTKSEQVLLYIVRELHNSSKTCNFVDLLLNNIQFVLFQLSRTPEFSIVESLSHFYAVLCRYFRLKYHLRLFILDAMYCLQFKAVPLIKQCLDVWMHILPLAHMGIAKTPLVTCLVYLLHFYKCEDKFNVVQDMRIVLSRKYFYQITEWNDAKILEMLRNCIKDLRDNPVEQKMLRMALIVLSKRRGPQWCHKNVIKSVLLPIVEKGIVSQKTKEFCLSMIGPLMKPFPIEMKLQSEIMVNDLLDMLEQNPSNGMKQAILISLIYMNKHNQNRVMQVLLSWKPENISEELEELLKDYVRDKPIKVWKKVLSKMTVQ